MKKYILQLPMYYSSEDGLKISDCLKQMAVFVRNRKPIPYKLNDKFLSYFDKDFLKISKVIDTIHRAEIINNYVDELINKFDEEYGFNPKPHPPTSKEYSLKSMVSEVFENALDEKGERIKRLHSKGICIRFIYRLMLKYYNEAYFNNPDKPEKYVYRLVLISAYITQALGMPLVPESNEKIYTNALLFEKGRNSLSELKEKKPDKKLSG